MDKVEAEPTRVVERIKVYNSRAKVIVEVAVRVTDGGRDAVDRFGTVDALVRRTVADTVNRELELAKAALDGSGVKLRFGTAVVEEKALDLNGTDSLHRLARELGRTIMDLQEGRVIPGHGEPGKLPGVDLDYRPRVRLWANTEGEALGSVDVEVIP